MRRDPHLFGQGLVADDIQPEGQFDSSLLFAVLRYLLRTGYAARELLKRNRFSKRKSFYERTPFRLHLREQPR